ncbi:MAG: zinc-dependent metalloprotease [Saprospiraceae bacterium]
MRPLLFSLLFLFGCHATKNSTATPTTPTTPTISTDAISSKTKGMQAYPGFFNFYWDEKQGKVWLEIDKFEQEFLYINSLQAGIGSNDIGLDRGQLGRERVVKFSRSGDKILMTNINYKYRANSGNADERLAVEEAFAQSVLWGFEVSTENKNAVLVDATRFLLQDAHGVAKRLQQSKQGTYKLEDSRSAVYLPRTKNFPKNTELEATITFVGEAKGDWIRSVTPTPDVVTVRMHHSLVELPDGNYQPRHYDPRSGYISTSYFDYATPIDQPVVKRFITRHRLEKKDPSAAISDPVEPIIYYLDRGAPEPIKSALMEGASWWNQAFEAAGYRNAFQVKELPPDADPMDVRYNLIQWVHRSTRGWSYGGGVNDPRTGEIIKGKVTLGSLRVRQDFLIAQGLLAAYENGDTPDPRLLEMALARLRQLSAHEVGHTLGFTHNFAASYNDRSSVMDYPHPYITMDDRGNIDFSKSYDDKIGEWDKRMVIYGYSQFAEGVNEKAALDKILQENQTMGLLFISDDDSRPAGSAHPYSHLWDNGTSPTAELRRMAKVRAKALENFGLNSIPNGTPLADLERILVPLYLSHRYQVEGVSKLIGGVQYTYTVKGFETTANDDWKPTAVSDEIQQDALLALLETLDTRYLEIPKHIRYLIPPQPEGYHRDRETFKSYTGLVFDPMAAAESSADNVIAFLLNPERLARLIAQKANDPERVMSVNYVFGQLLSRAFFNERKTVYQEEIAWMVEKLVVLHLIQLAADKSANKQVNALALYELDRLTQDFVREMDEEKVDDRRAHLVYMLNEISQFRQRPEDYQPANNYDLPDGSPIGCGGHF